jgi:hypothetical protein
MARTTFWQNLQAATALIAAVTVIAVPFGQASAADDEESPFGDAVKVADASLDTVRGGFATSDGGVMRFAMNLTTSVNGTRVASMSVDNLDGNFEFSSNNLGHTVTVTNNGTVQVQSGGPQTQFSTASVSFGAPGQGTPVPQVNSAPVTITTTLVPASLGTATSPGAPSPVTSATPSLSALNTAMHSNPILASTTLLPNGRGLMTVVQNVNSNVAINMVQTLNIQLHGLTNSLARSALSARAFSSSMNLSLHH